MRNLVVAMMVWMLGTMMVNASVLRAMEAQDHTALRQAIAAASPIEERNTLGQTALLIAVWRDDMTAAQILVEAGADVNASDNIADSPYLVAGAEGRVEILKLLLANGADLSSLNRFGGTALIPAAEKGHPDAVALLIKAGVDLDHINNLGWTALLEAVILTDGGPVAQKIVGQLLDAGANPNIADPDGQTALDHAKNRKFNKIIALLENVKK